MRHFVNTALIARILSLPVTEALPLVHGAGDHFAPVLDYALQSASDAGIHIATAANPAMGLGAFASLPIPQFTKIGMYTGEFLTNHEVKVRFHRKGHDDFPADAIDIAWEQSRLDRHQGVTGDYLFETNNGDYIDAEDSDAAGWCRFMNHASEGTTESNVKAFNQIAIGGDMVDPTFYTTRDIAAGEELMYDYGPLSQMFEGGN